MIIEPHPSYIEPLNACTMLLNGVADIEHDIARHECEQLIRQFNMSTGRNDYICYSDYPKPDWLRLVLSSHESCDYMKESTVPDCNGKFYYAYDLNNSNLRTPEEVARQTARRSNQLHKQTSADTTRISQQVAELARENVNL